MLEERGRESDPLSNFGDSLGLGPEIATGVISLSVSVSSSVLSVIESPSVPDGVEKASLESDAVRVTGLSFDGEDPGEVLLGEALLGGAVLGRNTEMALRSAIGFRWPYILSISERRF